MKNYQIVRQISLIVFMLLSACGGGNSPDVTLTELSTNVLSYDDIIRINNCGGKADSEQNVSRSFATTFEGGAELSAGYQSIAEGSISAKYSQYRNTTKSQRLIAPPGTNMEFVIRWSEDVRAGNVQVNGSSGSYEVRIPVSVEQMSSQDLGNCPQNSSQSSNVQPTSVINPEPVQPPAQISSAPLISHTVEGIGTGIFSQATYSDGSAVFSQQELNTSHSKIQLINPDSSSNGCGTAWYTVNEVWFGGASKTTLYLNGVAVGELFQGVGRHGYMIPLSVNAGDELCVKPIPPGGWNMNLGADIYYHYDSFCHRGYC